MIVAIGKKIRESGDKAIAASRGEGKSTLAERLALKYVLQGVVGFAPALHSTGSKAEDSLDEIKQAIENNPRLAADYPEVCTPVAAPRADTQPGALSARLWQADRYEKAFRGSKLQVLVVRSTGLFPGGARRAGGGGDHRHPRTGRRGPRRRRRWAAART